jgi:hypothetical protein
MTAREPTHILHWVPPYVDRDGGCWDLQTLADYDAGVEQTDPEWQLDGEPRDIDANDFTGWIGELVGYPVTVVEGFARITDWRRLRFRCKEPLFFVVPASPEEAP